MQHNNIPNNSGVHGFPGLTVILSSMHYRPALIETCQWGGHWGILETAKPKEKIIQNGKTAKKFGQNRKPHTKPSKTDTMVTSGAYRAN